MATVHGMRQMTSNRIGALAALLLTGAVFLMPCVASAQSSDAPSTPRPLRAREAISAAQDSYRRGDYDEAARLYQEAEDNKQQLNPDEQKNLAALIKANKIAVEASHTGAVRLRMAEKCIDEGDLTRAAGLVKAESGNQYLRPEDKALLGKLTDELKAKGIAIVATAAPSKASLPVDLSKEDYSTLVKMARSALQRGDFDTAELYCKQADKKEGMLPNWVTSPLGDSASKVMRDVQAARAKQAREQQQVAKADQPSMFVSGFNSVKSFFSPGSAQARTDPEGPQLNADKNMVAGPAATTQTAQTQPMVSKETLEARMLRDQAIEALKRDDLVSAKRYAEMAKARMDPNAWWEAPSPDQLLKDIDRHLAQVKASGGDPKSVPPWGAPVVVDAGNAKKCLKEARTLLAQGKLEEADKLCVQVAAAKVSWGLFEDNPEKLRGEIKSARLKADKTESFKVLAEARKLLAAGNFDEARAKAWKAKQLHGPYTIVELGDRPEKVLADIDVAEAKAKQQGGPGQTNVVKSNPIKSNSGTNEVKSGTGDGGQAVTVAALQTKQRAQALLEEARVLQQQGRFAEAKARAEEARAAAAEAARAGLGFGPSEESPDVFLLALACQAKMRMDSLVRSADDTAVEAADPARLKTASDNLAEARQLAVLFGLDMANIDLKLNWVAQRQTNPGAVLPARAQELARDNMGLKLLDDARNEIKAGRLKVARELAGDALDAKYGVQKQAEDMLRSIDIEEFMRTQLDADRAFTVAYEAFLRKDYAQARSILANVDERLLSPEKKARLREIAMSSEMQQQKSTDTVKLTGGPIDVQSPGTANANDLSLQGSKGGDEFAQIKAMNQVVEDQMLKAGYAAQRAAQDRAKGGDFDGAIEVLRGYSASLRDSGLDADRVAVLGKSTDRYVQQYQTLKAQKAFEKEQKAASGTDHEKQRLIKQQETQAEVAKLADQANQFMRDHQFEQAHVAYAKIQELDPDNITAQAGMFQSAIRAQEKRNALDDEHSRDGFLEDTRFDRGPLLSGTHPVNFNPDITARANSRVGLTVVKTGLKDPVELALQRALKEKKVTLSFTNRPMRECIDDIRALVGLNILTDDNAISKAGIVMERPVTLSINDISLESALTNLLKKVGLTFVVQNQVIFITTEDNAQGSRFVYVHPVADLVIPLESARSMQGELLKARNQNQINNQLSNGLSSTGPNSYAPPNALPPASPVGTPLGGYSGGSANTLMGKPVKPETIDDLKDALIRLIKNTIAPKSWDDVGGEGTIQWHPLGLGLVVGQTQDIQEQIIDLLAALRRLQDLEVAIEMRLVSVAESFFEFMGVNFGVSIPTGNSATSIQTLTSGNFSQPGQINIFNQPGFVSGLTPAGTLTPNLAVPLQSSSFGFALPPFGGYPGTLGADGGLSLGLAFLSDVQVTMFMEAAQGDRRTNVTQAPKLTVFNGQTASINVGDELTFLDTINVVQLNGQMVFQPQQNRVPYGVFMTVTPVVSADRRFVRLNLNPTLQNLATATVPLLPVQQIVPQLLYDNLSPPQQQVFTLFFQQPAQSFITLNTTVMVPDGGTVLMGGLKTLVEGRNEAGPPILDKIPYLNRLFTNVGYGKETQSLMIMVTVRIIVNEEEELEFRGQLQPIPRN